MTDRSAIVRASGILHQPGQVVEVRALFRDGRIMTGSFCDTNQLIDWCVDASDDATVQRVQWSVQDVRGDWPVQNNMDSGRKALTKADVVHREFIFCDIDSDRPEGADNATEEELQATWLVVKEIVRWCHERGIAKPFITCSGNGFHLLWRVNWFSDDTHNAIAKDFLVMLNEKWPCVDFQTHSIEREPKVPGCMGRKGESTATRPWRVCEIISKTETIECVNLETLKTVLAAEGYPKAAPPRKHPKGLAADFDVYDLLEYYDCEILGEIERGGKTLIIPAECPIAGRRHRGGRDVSAFVLSDDHFGYSCLACKEAGEDASIGDVLRKWNDESEYEPYPHPIWADSNRIAVEDVANIEAEEAVHVVTAEELQKVFEPSPVAVMAPEPEPASIAVAVQDELLYPELAFPYEHVCKPGSQLKALVDYACMGGDGTPHVLDPGLVTEAMLTLASSLPIADNMLDTRINRYSVLLAVSRGGKGMSWQRAYKTLGMTDGKELVYYSPSGHVQMIYALGDKQEHKSKENPNPARIPGPRKMCWITEELSGCLKMAKSDGSKIMQQLLEFFDRNLFIHTDTKTNRTVTMDCRLSWGTNLAVGFGKIEERKFSDAFQDVSNDGLIGRMSFGFSEREVDSRDLEGWNPPACNTTENVNVEGIGEMQIEKNQTMASQIMRHEVRGYEPGVFDAYRLFSLGKDSYPGYTYALKKNMLHIALVNLHPAITMDDFQAAVAYVRWQGQLRKMFRPSQADDYAQSRFQEMVMRALRKADTLLEKQGKPVEQRTIYVPRIAQRHEWSNRGKSIGLDKTIVELANNGMLVLDSKDSVEGRKVPDWQHVRVVHNSVGCWCAKSHPKPDAEAEAN